MATVEEMKDKVEKQVDQEAMYRAVSTATVKLKEPFTHTGETYTEIKMDFASLTGEQFEAIDDELTVMGAFVVLPTASRKYQRILAAKAAGVPSDVIEALPAREYLAVVNAARRFLQATV